ncbi:MAG: hypothetical protein JOZ36_09765 [Acidobacteria bacterium]|nr:hypothetical protein [Acidobacteriota bacterium]
MRRVLAHLALAVTCIGILSPLLAAAQLSTVHACCLRKGSHHCHELSGLLGEQEFRAQHELCPYSARITLSTFHGLQATKFELGSPWIFGIIHQIAVESGFCAATREWCARGPPTVFL